MRKDPRGWYPSRLLIGSHGRYCEIAKSLVEAERDLRMMKTKQKISGCFRNLTHAKAFANLRSIIASAKKQSINVLDILKTTLVNPSQTQALLLGT